MTQPLVFSGWSALSAFGIGRDDFVQGLRSGRSAVSVVDREQWRTPFTHAGLVPGFDTREVLGNRGTRAMDRVTGLAVKATGLLLDDLAGELSDSAETGLVLGTTAGSVASMMEFVKDSFVQDKPFHVDPARFPNAVMNRSAGQCAIWYGLRGPNATVAGGRAAGLLVLRYAARLHRRGRARSVLCGMVEEFSEHRAWLEYLAAGGADRPSGEGCAMFVLETAGAARAAGRTVLAELLGLRIGVWGDHAPVGPELARLLRALLAEAGVTPRQVQLVAVSGAVETEAHPGAFAAETGAVAMVLGPAPIVAVADLVGETGAATAGFQLAALLSADTDVERSYMVLTSVDQDGVLGCALLRRTETDSPETDQRREDQ